MDFRRQIFLKIRKGLEVSKALSIDAEVPFRTHFPLLGSDIDSSFYDIEEDEVYFFKGDYVYSYKNSNK